MIKRRKISTYSSCRKSSSNRTALDAVGRLRQIDVRGTVPKTPRGRLFSNETAGNSSIDVDIEESTIEAKNTRKLFSFLIKTLKRTEELHCARQLEEMYYSEEKYLEQLNQLHKAKIIMGQLKYYKLCKEVDGPKMCKHKIRRRKCDQRSSETEPFLAKSHLDVIFIPILSIRKMHERLLMALRSELSLVYESAHEGKSISVTKIIRIVCREYLEIAPLFICYAEYIKSFQRSIDTIQRLKDNLAGFNESWENVGQSAGAPVMFLINQPLMRVTKYPVIFKSFIKRVKKLIELADNIKTRRGFVKVMDILSKTSKKVGNEVERVNNKIGLGREMQKMRDINEEIGHKLKNTVLLEPSRKFKKELYVKRFEIGGDVILNSCCFVFVFNDLIIVAADESDVAYAKKKGRGTRVSSLLIPQGRRDSRVSSVSVSSHLLSLSSFKQNGGSSENLSRTMNRRSRSSSLALKHSSARITRTDSRLSMQIKKKTSNANSFNGSQGGLYSSARSRAESFQSAQSRRSRNMRGNMFKSKRKTVEELPPARKLEPVAEMKMCKLISPQIIEETVAGIDYQVLCLTYDEFSGDDDICVKLYFENIDECKELELLYRKEHEELISNELQFNEIIRARSIHMSKSIKKDV